MVSKFWTKLLRLSISSRVTESCGGQQESRPLLFPEIAYFSGVGSVNGGEDSLSRPAKLPPHLEPVLMNRPGSILG
jgi:hypothetical protein